MMLALLVGYSYKCGQGSLTYARRSWGASSATNANAFVNMAVHRGRSRQAARAAASAAIDMRFCTGTVGTLRAKWRKSMTIRRGTDSPIARPRIGSLQG